MQGTSIFQRQKSSGGEIQCVTIRERDEAFSLHGNNWGLILVPRFVWLVLSHSYISCKVMRYAGVVPNSTGSCFPVSHGEFGHSAP